MKKLRMSFLFTMLFSAEPSFCQTNQHPPYHQKTETLSVNREVQEVRNARLEQNRAMARGDVEGAASFWTEDVTLRRGLGAAISGKEAYRKLLDQQEGMTYEREPDFIEVSSHWPLAYESGTWTARTREGQKAITGRYSAHWVKREERWLIRSELFVALECFEAACTFSAAP